MATKGRVQVFARCRPPLEREAGDRLGVKMQSELKKVTVEMEDGDAVDRVLAGGDFASKSQTRCFEFDAVFDLDSDQKDVFSAVGKPVLKDCLMGYNGAILAYGQTGAGKTHSLLNNAGAKPKEAGLLPRTVAALYVYIGGDAAHVYTVEAAAFQIYNEQLDDLLCEDRNKNNNLTVKVGGDVVGLTWTTCKGPDELLKQFQRARNNVIYAETKMNKASSRSHSVFQIKISKRPRATEAKAGGGAVQMQATMGKLTVVDLAGSERVKRSGVSGAGLKEAANINASLLAFGNVVQALADKKKHVPFRDSKLTRILEDSVGGNCKTSLLVCCSPSVESCHETVSTLEFAARAMRVETTCTVNEVTVTVDAARLAADMAGEGIDEAVRKKAEEMRALQEQVAAKFATAAKEAQKLKDAAASERSDMERAVEVQKKLVEQWKAKVEAVTAKKEAENLTLMAKVEELQAALQEAMEGHEAKAKVVEMEVALATLQEQMQDMEAKSTAEVARVEKDYQAQVSSLESQLADSGTERAQEASSRAESEAALQEVTRQLSEVQRELDRERMELQGIKARMADEQKKTSDAHRRACWELQEKHRKEMEELHAKFAEQARSQAKSHAAELEGVQAGAARDLADRDKEWRGKMGAREEELEAARRAAVEAKEREIANLNALTVKKDETISKLHKQSEELEARIVTTKAEMKLQEQGFRDNITKLADEAEREKAEIQAQTAHQIHSMAQEHAEQMEQCAAEDEIRLKRQQCAFTAARGVLKLKMSVLEQELKSLTKRFNKRESRSDDLQKIRELERDIRAAKTQQNQQAFLAHQLKLELDNRDESDRVFGGAPLGPSATLGGNLNKSNGGPLRPSSHRAPLVPNSRRSSQPYVGSTGFRY